MGILLHELFAKPKSGHLRVSARGRWVAWVARGADGVLNIWAQQRNAGTRELGAVDGPLSAVGDPGAARQLTFAKDWDICFLFVFSLDERYLLYLRETANGNEFYHLYALDLESEDPWATRRDLIEDPKITVAVGFIGGVQIWQPPETPRQLLLGVGRGSLFWNVERINIDTAERTIVAQSPVSTWWGRVRVLLGIISYLGVRLLSLGLIRPSEAPSVPVIQWFPDPHRGYEIRGRVEATIFPELSMCLSVKSRSTGRWTRLQTVPFSRLNMQLLGSQAASGTLRIDFYPGQGEEAADTVSVHTCDFFDTTSYVTFVCGKDNANNGKALSSPVFRKERVVAHNEQCDIDGFLCHPRTRSVQATLHTFEKTEFSALDDAVVPDLQFFEKRFAGLETHVVHRSFDDAIWIIHVSGDRRPGDYYFYERGNILVATNASAPKAERTDAKIFHFLSVHPQLEGAPLVAMRTVRIPTRDGESILGYLSLPETRTGRLVLFVHGGPSTRDSWGFDPAVQLLAARGIAVLQLNYRGSTGLGTRFMQLPYGDIDKIRQDVADGARWAVQEQVAAKNRVAILGASWGGYEALCGMVFDGELYACGVAIVPISSVGAANPSQAFRNDPLVRRYWDRLYGSQLSKDRRAAEALSPLHNVEKIGSPLMLVHGDRDPRVPKVHSDRIAVALQKAEIPVYYVSYPDEGHGVKKESNRLDMWGRVERFLCRGLELPAPPPPDPNWTHGHSAVVHFDGFDLCNDGDQTGVGSHLRPPRSVL